MEFGVQNLQLWFLSLFFYSRGSFISRVFSTISSSNCKNFFQPALAFLVSFPHCLILGLFINGTFLPNHSVGYQNLSAETSLLSSSQTEELFTWSQDQGEGWWYHGRLLWPAVNWSVVHQSFQKIWVQQWTDLWFNKFFKRSDSSSELIFGSPS